MTAPIILAADPCPTCRGAKKTRQLVRVSRPDDKPKFRTCLSACPTCGGTGVVNVLTAEQIGLPGLPPAREW